MAVIGRVYNGATKIAEGASPIAHTGLTASTTYNLKLAKYDDVTKEESAKVDVPEFTTEAAPAE